MSVSSVWWHDGAHFEDGVLEVRIRQEDEDGKKLASIAIRLDAATGRLLRPVAIVKAIEDEKTLCQSLFRRQREEDWKACLGNSRPAVWCALCRSMHER